VTETDLMKHWKWLWFFKSRNGCTKRTQLHCPRDTQGGKIIRGRHQPWANTEALPRSRRKHSKHIRPTRLSGPRRGAKGLVKKNSIKKMHGKATGNIRVLIAQREPGVLRQISHSARNPNPGGVWRSERRWASPFSPRQRPPYSGVGAKKLEKA